VGSEGFSRFPSPHSLVGSDGFVPMSIVPTVSGLRQDVVMLCDASRTYIFHKFEFGSLNIQNTKRLSDMQMGR